MASSGIGKRRQAAKSEGGTHYRKRRQELIQAAARTFRAKGLSATSLDDVAKEAGVDRATLYYYVGNKSELFEEVVLGAVVANVEMAEKIRDGDELPTAKLERLISEVLASYAEYYPHLYVFLQEDAETLGVGKRKDGVEIAELQRRFDRAIVEIIEQGVESGAFRSDLPARLAAYGIVGMVNWTHRWFNPDGPVGAREVGKAFASMAIAGLRKQ